MNDGCEILCPLIFMLLTLYCYGEYDTSVRNSSKKTRNAHVCILRIVTTATNWKRSFTLSVASHFQIVLLLQRGEQDMFPWWPS